VSDRPDDGHEADDDLDSTIDKLELLLERTQQLLDVQQPKQGPPVGAIIPILTDKIVDVSALHFNSPAASLRAF
jgi:hypothetical protein